MNKLLQRLFAPVAALLALGAAPADARAPQTARPALWAVSDADTTIYLFGTIHLLPENYQWRTAKFDQAVGELAAAGGRNDRRREESDEADVARWPASASRQGPAAARRAGAAATSAPRSPRRSRRAAIRAQALRPDGNLGRRLHPARQPVQGHGPQGPAKASRACFASNFTGQGKPIGELETNVEQLGFFDQLPEKRAARSCSKARSSQRERHERGFQRHARRLVARRRQRHRPDLQSRSRRLAGASRSADQAAQRQLEQVDRAAHGPARRGHDRGRRRPPRRARIRSSIC